MTQSKYLVLDFDGVICNSDKECCLVAIITWNKINNINQIVEFDKIEHIFYKKFCLLRPFIKGAKEYYYLMKFLNQKNNISINNFIKFKKNELDTKKISIFEKLFYETREEIKKDNYQNWLSLNYVYIEVINFVKQYFHNRFIILTMKDRKSVYDIIKNYLPNLNKNLIYDFKAIKNKLDGLEKIKTDFNLNKSQIIFVDDIPDHLISPKDNNYKVCLSNWNNKNNDLYLKFANKYKIKVINNITELKLFI